MCADLIYDSVVKKAKEMRDRSFGCKFPDQAVLWKNLLSNEMADSLPIGIALFDRNFVLLNCNKLYQEYINAYSYYSPNDVIGMEYFDFFADAESTLLEVFKSVRDNGQQHTSYEFPVELDKRLTNDLTTYWDAKLISMKDIVDPENWTMC
jgi:hypothetical protein